ncbi:MAG TPA: PAS domain-containing sensor histidine kinase, partial [Aggregatilineales bacterium]|nr:PAS domain-containing sensor histidine kinase [Aggregatilineales bacterium]
MKHQTRMPASFQIALFYVIFAAVWIFFSDSLLALLHIDTTTFAYLEITKGILFVLVTGVLLHIFIQREFRSRERITEQYHTLFDFHPQPMLIFDAESLQILAVNPKAVEHYGYTENNFLALTIKDLFLKEEGEAFAAVLQQSTKTAKTEQHGMRWQQKKNGEVFEAEVTSSPIIWEGHRAQAMHAYDLSARRELEATHLSAEQLRVELQRQRAIAELKDQIMSTVIHELKTPLALIMSTVNLMQNYSDRLNENDRARRLERVIFGVERINSMLDNMMRLRQSGANRVSFNPVELKIQDFCNEVLETFRAQNLPHEFILRHSGHIRAQFDADLMHHILENLVSNAVKYSPDGTTISLCLEVKDTLLIIQVGDHGIGIPEEAQERLFEPFYRAANTDEIEGTGLGLAIVKEYVELHDGSIRFESKVGEGTTFTIEIPREPS